MLSIQERLALHTEPIDGALWQWLCILRVATVAIVESFDPDRQTCVLQPTLQEWILAPPPATSQTPNPGSSQNIPTSYSLPKLYDVPIIMMRVTGYSITFPIVSGTECLVIHADSCIDSWFQNGGVCSSIDRRRHSISDGFAIFGPWSQKRNLQNYSTDSMQIRSDDLTQAITIGDSSIDISSSMLSLESTSGDMTLTGNVVVEGNLHVESGASGSFTSQTGQIITVQDGIIISIQ